MIQQQSALNEALQKYFGFNQFKSNQAEIIESILSGKDTFVIKAHRWRKILMLSASGHPFGRNRHCYFAFNCLDEKSSGFNERL
jgi:hypothetical protein